jgi:hypothetical protein
MSEQPNKTVSLSYEQLQALLSAVLKEANKPNALEQKQIDAEMEREKRRALLAVELGKAEEQARWRRQNSCSHSAHEKTGESVPYGKGKWTTGGQMHTDGTASLICQRCATIWRWKATPDEQEFIINGPGLLGCAPPEIERCVNRDEFVLRRPA